MSKILRHVLAAALLAVAVGAIAAPGPARAGGWASAVLEPMPAQLRPHQTYTVGLWVLQHGFHPYEGELDKVALRLVDSRGTVTTYDAVKLPEPGHYAVSIVLPHEGAFAVTGIQGWFPEYEIGTISTDGGLRQLPTVAAPTEQHLAEYWPGAVKPPVLPVDQNRDPFRPAAPPPAAPAAFDPAPAAATEPAPASSSPSPWLAVLAGVAALFLAGSVLFGRRRFALSRRHP
ncbi:hypothetical protein O7635_01095 [Asanoa sp. WMMD1127]|uniref:hypothetical protein n=1 Tax=Asanoa sp. WMMD1127 TaxID=3016107 RepID=UPI002416C551|nr:hypothetical protein [Asanoa sp. WMMD1127]MDG4820448.1 hypothetical protein [Asanoa sp. WMMD1127]